MITTNDLFFHQTELIYYALIMMGLCTGAFCLTLVWCVERLIKALENNNHMKEDMLDLRRAFGFYSKRMTDAEFAVRRLARVAKRLVDSARFAPRYCDEAVGD